MNQIREGIVTAELGNSMLLKNVLLSVDLEDMPSPTNSRNLLPALLLH